MPKFAANLSFLFQELPFLERFDAARKAGFEAVEYLFPYDHDPAEIAARLDANGLTQALFNLPPGDWQAGERGLAALPGREADFRASVEEALPYAEALGCERLHVMAGVVPTGADARACEETYVANLAFAAGALREAGARALIEPLNATDMPGYLLSTSGHARRVVETVGGDNLFLQYDLYHRQIMEGNLVAGFERHRPIIAHIQIAGVPGRHEPSLGEINYPYLFDVIDESGYDGWIGCEYRPLRGTLEGLGWLAAYGIGAVGTPGVDQQGKEGTRS